jgi:DNA-binding NtrC family response regulator
MPSPNAVPDAARRSIRVLVADGAAAVRDCTVAVLRLSGFEVSHCRRGEEAVDLLRHNRFDIVIAEQGLRPVDGLAVLRAARADSGDSKVIITAARPTEYARTRAQRLGAWHYLPKPFSATQLQLLVGLAAKGDGRAPPRDTAGHAEPALQLVRAPAKVTAPIGRAPAFRLVVDLARRIAPIDIPVLLRGEPGTGKSVLARFIHRHSRRAARPLVSIACSGMPESQLESELFGHRGGSLAGLLKIAAGGTLVLEDVLEMPKSAQAMLERALEDRDVRLLATTRGDPERAVRDGGLREDLFYRLNVIQLELPSLRQRVEDIALLARTFLTIHWRRHHRETPVPKLSPRAMQTLSRLPWRGNVPELQTVIEWAALSAAPEREIEPEDLPTPLAGSSTVDAAVAGTPSDDLFDQPLEAASARFLAGFESRYVQWVIDRAGGNIATAARLAGVARATLYRMMHRHGLHLTRSTTWLPSSQTGNGERPSHLSLVPP